MRPRRTRPETAVLLVSLKGACCGGHAGTGNAGREQLAWRTDADPHRLERKTRCSSSAGTLAHTSDIDMPASTHEMVRSPDGRKFYASVHGGGTFVRNEDAGRHIAVIDLVLAYARAPDRRRRASGAAFADDGRLRRLVVDGRAQRSRNGDRSQKRCVSTTATPLVLNEANACRWRD